MCVVEGGTQFRVCGVSGLEGPQDVSSPGNLLNLSSCSVVFWFFLAFFAFLLTSYRYHLELCAEMVALHGHRCNSFAFFAIMSKDHY